MGLLIIGSELFGVWGVLAAAPAGSIVRDVFKYLYGVWSDDAPPAVTPRELPDAADAPSESEPPQGGTTGEEAGETA